MLKVVCFNLKFSASSFFSISWWEGGGLAANCSLLRLNSAPREDEALRVFWFIFCLPLLKSSACRRARPRGDSFSSSMTSYSSWMISLFASLSSNKSSMEVTLDLGWIFNLGTTMPASLLASMFLNGEFILSKSSKRESCVSKLWPLSLLGDADSLVQLLLRDKFTSILLCAVPKVGDRARMRFKFLFLEAEIFSLTRLFHSGSDSAPLG